MPEELTPLPCPFDRCYEWITALGVTRRFRPELHNGQGPDRSVTLFTADQMRAYALENRRAQPAPSITEHQSKWGRLYTAANALIAAIGFHGRLDTDSPEVKSLQDKLHDLDSGEWMPGLMPAQPEPAAPSVAPEPLKGWKLNHVQFVRGTGKAEIGYLDSEDDRFSPIVTVDTGLYYEPDQAHPLAVAILGALQAANPPRAPLTEGALMGIYMEFDRHADKAWTPTEYLLRFAAAVDAHGIRRQG